MSIKSQRVLQVVILICIYLAASAMRIGVCRHFAAKHSPFMPFTGESALLYRYAEMAAADKDIPELDCRAQYPEGLLVKHQLSLGWEFIAGFIYRLFPRGKITFHSFVRYFTPLFFSIGIIPLFLIINTVSREESKIRTTRYEIRDMNIGAIVGTLFYAVSLPAIIRATGQEISRENYCLPLLFFHIYFLTKYMKGKRGSSLLPAGLFLYLALAFWEGVQVYFYVLVLFMVLNFILKRDAIFQKGFAVLTAFAFFAGISIPYLRTHFFITSYPMLISYALIAAEFLTTRKRGQAAFSLDTNNEIRDTNELRITNYELRDTREGVVSHRYKFSQPRVILNGVKNLRRFFVANAPQNDRQWCGSVNFLSRRTRNIVLITLIAALILIAHPVSGYGRTYSHMRSLLWYKIRFLNQKPSDPNLLPYDVRILWTPALTSPSGRTILFHFSTLLLLGTLSVIPTVGRMFKRRIGPVEEFLFVNLLMFFLLYLMFSRMEVFLIFFICIFIGKWVVTVMKYPVRKAALISSVVFLCIFFEGSKVVAHIDDIGRPVDYDAVKDIISWIRRETPEKSVILSHFNLSPVILTYTNRKIVLHPKFESADMREKVRKYLFALFDHSEEEFYSFCQKVGADFFIYPKGTFSTSSLYSWRYMTATPRTDRNANAYAFERCPRKLKNFELKYNNGRYVVYKIYQRDELQTAMRHLGNGDEYMKRCRYMDAINEYSECIRIYPGCQDGYARLGTAYYLNGEKKKARECWQIAYQMRLRRSRRR